MSLCKGCTDAFQTSTLLTTEEGYHRDDRVQHLSILGFLEAVDEKCYICWRTFQAIDEDVQHLMRKVGNAVKNCGEDGVFVACGGANFPLDGFSTLRFDTKEASKDYRIEAEHLFSRHYFESLARSHNEHCANDSCNVTRNGKVVHDIEAVGTMLRNFYYTHTFESYDGLTGGSPIEHCVPKSPGTDSLETFALIQSWIQDCITNHKTCHARQGDQTWRPTRLIDSGDLSGDATKLPETCRLVGGAEVVPNERYVTLSHRWGKSDIIQLTAACLNEFRLGICMALLPATFIDCISVARRICIRYVWIDSLCIVQSGDDGVDWLREAATMHQVYSNAYCNISVDWSLSSQSIFTVRDLRLFEQIRFDVDVQSKRTVERRTFSSIEDRLWDQEVSKSPLNGRGWVLQERLLSARNLHFGRREVFWECCKTVSCETYPDIRLVCDLGVHSTTAYLKTFEPRLLPYSIDRSIIDHQLNLSNFTIWHDIVRTYSKTRLTIVSDKLVALSGIARHMKTILQDTYVAGVWLGQLPGELMWRTNHFELCYEASTPYHSQWNAPHEYRAPTFSWASIDTEINPGAISPTGIIVDVCCIKYRPSAMVEDAQWEDETVTDDVFGPISSPAVELKVIGKVVPCQLIKTTKSYRGTYVCPLRYIEPNDAQLANPIFDRPVQGSQVEDYLRKVYYYVPWQHQTICGDDQDSLQSSFLLLDPIDVKMGRFQRIGIFFAWQNRDGFVPVGGDPAHYMRAAEGTHEVDSWSYDKETNLHTIYIV